MTRFEELARRIICVGTNVCFCSGRSQQIAAIQHIVYTSIRLINNNWTVLSAGAFTKQLSDLFSLVGLENRDGHDGTSTPRTAACDQALVCRGERPQHTRNGCILPSATQPPRSFLPQCASGNTASSSCDRQRRDASPPPRPPGTEPKQRSPFQGAPSTTSAWSRVLVTGVSSCGTLPHEGGNLRVH